MKYVVGMTLSKDFFSLMETTESELHCTSTFGEDITAHIVYSSNMVKGSIQKPSKVKKYVLRTNHGGGECVFQKPYIIIPGPWSYLQL